MSIIHLDSYLEVLRRSGLVEATQIDKLIQALTDQCGGRRIDTPILSRALLETRLITPWQNKMLLKGLWRGFFLGRYKLLKELGAGGMSSVYLAEHVLLRRRVAIKVLHQKRASNRSHLTRFYRESRTTAGLDHPNIVRVFDFDTDGKFHYLVMELVEGTTLQELVDRRGPLSYLSVANYVSQTAAGLTYAHDKGLIHRDVKPANLLVTPTGLVKILDLGLARIQNQAGPSLTVDDGSVLGTVDYLAPEQALDSHNVDSRADVYALGCTMYFALTGSPPFSNGTMAVRLMRHQSDQALPLSHHRNDIPPALERLCKAMMSKRIVDRPTAAQVHEQLQQWLIEQGQRAFYPSVFDLTASGNGHENSDDTVVNIARTIVGMPANHALAPDASGILPPLQASADGGSSICLDTHHTSAKPSTNPGESAIGCVIVPPGQSGIGLAKPGAFVTAEAPTEDFGVRPLFANQARPNQDLANQDLSNQALLQPNQPQGAKAARCPRCSAEILAPVASVERWGKCPQCRALVLFPDHTHSHASSAAR